MTKEETMDRKNLEKDKIWLKGIQEGKVETIKEVLKIINDLSTNEYGIIDYYQCINVKKLKQQLQEKN